LNIKKQMQSALMDLENMVSVIGSDGSEPAQYLFKQRITGTQCQDLHHSKIMLKDNMH